jgi:predicted CxxxxCH...CXXCH cytochrome family protein
MRHAVLGAVCAITASSVLGFGCSSPPPGPNSFTQVYSTVIAKNCTNVYCHDNGVSVKTSGGLDMSSQVIAYWSLVDHILEGPSCGDVILQKRVIPFQPENSVMYLKVSEANPPCGVQMPADPYLLWPTWVSAPEAVFSGTPLSAQDQQLIYNWIEEGAQNN